MKKITFMLIALLVAVVTFAALSGSQSESPFKYLSKAEIAKAQPTLKMKGVDRKAMPIRNGVKKAPEGAELVTPPETAAVETYYTTGGKFYVATESSWADATSDMATVNVAIEGTDMYIQGLAYWFNEAWVKGTIDGATVTFPSGQLLGTDEYGDEFLVGSDDGETLADNIIFSYDSENGVLTSETVYLLESGEADDVSPYCYWYQPVFSTTEPEVVVPEVVEVPEGLETEEYVVSARNYKDDADVNGSVLVGFDGTDVYIQGLCTFIPDAWVKGELDGNTVTFATGQYFGIYADTYDMYLNVLMGEDVVFDYDAEAGTLTAQNEFFLVDNDQYYFDSYRGAVLAKVIEKAAMPANPAITALKNGNYGWYITFNVPNLDINGDGLVSSKLSYIIYTDIEGEIAPLTFTPETHTHLTEDMTEIPYGFTENWDFYDTQIYLNELYSADWNNIGIQSIYRGGDEENATEIQWFHIKDYAAPAGGDFTFDFNNMNVPTSSSVSTDGDITEEKSIAEGDVLLTISPKEEGKTTENRFWSTSAGPQLRVYSGTLTFEAPAGLKITQILFNHNGKWDEGNAADSGELTNDADAKVATWTGEAQTVVISIAANTQINSIVVTVEGEGGTQPIEPGEGVFTFEDGTMQGWTTIDADGDGYTWILGASPSINTVNESNYSVYSQSYASSALTPDNYLVSPKIKLDGSISFYACAQDAAWPSEHFGVAVSTAGNVDAADFTTVEEWTMTASRVDNATAEARGLFRSPKKAPGSWYLYTVDLSSFEGAEGYVAIRHFDCTDFFYLVVDNITLETSQFFQPDYTITPAEGTVESLDEFTLTFNNYDIELTPDAAATLTNETTGTSANGNIIKNGNALTIKFDETSEPGEYTLAIVGVQTEGEAIELNFAYTIEAAPEVVVLPEGLEAETWYLAASASESSLRNQEVAVAIDGSDIYIQGLNVDYLPEAWVKGTIEGNTATFPTGQYFGAFEYNGDEYDMFFVGFDYDGTGEIADVVFDFDAEAGTLTTDTWIVISAYKDEVSYYEYYKGATITREPAETPDLVVLPEGVDAEAWALEGFYSDGSDGTDVQRPVGVAFDGTDVYVQGLAYWFEESWLKGTLDAETGIVTFPKAQFVGEDEYGMEYMIGFDEDFCDIQYTYDAEAKTLTQLTPFILESSSETGLDEEGDFAFWGLWEVSRFFEGEPVAVEPVEAPEGLETETYIFNAMEIVENDESDLARKLRKIEGDSEVTIDFNSMEVATSNNNGGTDGDITEEYNIDIEDVISLTISPKEEGKTTENRFWGTNNGPQLRMYSGTLTFEVPEGCKMTQIVFNNAKWNDGNTADSGEFNGATWTGDAQKVVVTIAGNTQINSIDVTIEEGEAFDVTMQPYKYQMQVGFDGNDVYFKGFTDNTAEMWIKGTLSEDGKTVTIPANQYLGYISVLFSVYDYYITAINDEYENEDIVLNYDAETSTFSTDQVISLNGSKFVYYPYQSFTAVEITKMQEFATTPADPSIEGYKLEGVSYPYINFVVPAVDVDGNDILTDKLFYTVWIEKDNVEQPFVVFADEYQYVEEDWTEIPYNWDDSYDIYKGGSKFYINPTDVVTTWTKIGIQSIYYGGGECNKSNIVWMENPVYDPTTGISNVNVNTANNVVIFDLQGRRVAAPAKGLYIMNGKKVVVK